MVLFAAVSPHINEHSSTRCKSGPEQTSQQLVHVKQNNSAKALLYPFSIKCLCQSGLLFAIIYLLERTVFIVENGRLLKIDFTSIRLCFRIHYISIRRFDSISFTEKNLSCYGTGN